MATSIALIGDPQVQKQEWLPGLEQRWKKQKAGRIQRYMDRKWHGKRERSREQFAHVLGSVTTKEVAEYWFLGDMIQPESFNGLTDDANYMWAHELADWVRTNYPTVWQKRRVLTGNEDLGYRHPCATADECRLTSTAFERYETVWGPYLHEVTHNGWTLIGFSSDLLLLDGVGGNAEAHPLWEMRHQHLRKLATALEAADRVLLLFHSPEVFRYLRDGSMTLMHPEPWRTINGCWHKVRACFVGHLEIPGALKHYKRYQLAQALAATPLANIARLIFSPPDAVGALRTHVAGCAEASRLMHPKTVLVPAARHGWVELVLDHEAATVLHHAVDGEKLTIEHIAA